MVRQHENEMTVLNVQFLPRGFAVDDTVSQSDTNVNHWNIAFESDKLGALFHLGFLTREKWFSPSLAYLHQISELLIRKLSRQSEIELNRHTIQVDLNENELYQLIEGIPFVLGMEYIDDNWINTIWNGLLEVFRKEILDYDGTVERYFTEYNANINVVGRVFFHLVESKDEQYPFAFMATYSTKPIKSKRAIHTPLKNALREFEGDEKKLLALISTVVKTAEKSAFISELLENGELFSPLKLTVEEAYIVLREIPIYEEAGIMCRVPDWWRKKNNAIRLSISVGEKEPSKVGLDAIMDFSPCLRIEDDVLTKQELKAFLEMAEGLVQFKGKWVEIDKAKLAALIQAFDKITEMGKSEVMTLKDALRLELNMHKLLTLAEEKLDVSITNGQWLKTIKDKILHPNELDTVAIEPSFHAVLRTYQESGYHWLNHMSRFGFGACLADDMGLGKTVQMIAFLETKRIHSGGRALLVLPASLIGNWQKELERFAPEMPYQVLHKSDVDNSAMIQINESKFLFITTYGMATRMESLKQRKWDYLILDEAQAIKNPGAKQTKAVKDIPAKMRIALTGTPIENRLGDLWSLFDFLNNGLLGTSKEFTDFSKSLSDNPSGYSKLRKMIQPFMLRRLKTDKTIISDLPNKIEINVYTTLSAKQTALYKQLIDQISKKLDDVDGMERRGLVLTSITKFKQICNHPDQYLGREEYKPIYSGKFEQLKEICETIYEKRERVLVFTQYKEMVQPLSDFLKSIFLKEGFVLHGGTQIKRRSEMVEQFNGEHYIPYMVLSLKAGGVGLNLTAANHVIHFDRWWNPAVENQATDRVFRIGQSKNVMVHKFVTKGTIEEKIDKIIFDKQKLSGDILSTSGEKWITEYNNDELMKIFALEDDVQ